MRFYSIKDLGDCTSVYDISFDYNEEYTVGEFIGAILSDRGNKEWGYFKICPTQHGINYKDGLLLNTDDNPMLDEEIVSIPVKSVQCNGGWSRMDYYIYIK